MRLTRIFFAASLAALAGCTTTGTESSETMPGTTTARTSLVNASGEGAADVTLSQEPGGVRLAIVAAGLTPGTYGAHVHTTGICTPPDFTTAGAHWNPTAKQHGRDNPLGAHEGDLPNLIVGTDGQGRMEAVMPGATLAALMDADGAAVVVHAKPDDYRTDPSGNSGARIACGVLAAG